MSILLVDIGNTRVKWARITGGAITRQRAAAHSGWTHADFAEAVLGGVRGIERVLVASVGGRKLDRSLAAALRAAGAVAPQFIQSARRLGGVTTAYTEPWRLGVDRLVAVIGARALAPGRAVCVVDVGTAMTIDLVNSVGRHVGGAIIPGPELMVESLLHNTSGILTRAKVRSANHGLFARNTRAAIDAGARYAAASVVDRAVKEADRALGGSPRLFLTGGAAPAIGALIRSRHSSVPDLVLRGLAALI